MKQVHVVFCPRWPPVITASPALGQKASDPAPKFTDERGSTTVESVGVSLALIAVVTVGLACSYLSFAKLWLDRCAYESTVCLASTASESACKQKLRAGITRALPIGSIQNLSLMRSNSWAVSQFTFQVSEKIRLREQIKLELPLQSEPRSFASEQ